MNQQRRPEHLSDGNRVACGSMTGPEPGKEDRNAAQQTAENDSRVEVWMERPAVSVPGEWRTNDHDHDGKEPLPQHQHRKHPVDSLPYVLPLLPKQLLGTRSNGYVRLILEVPTAFLRHLDAPSMTTVGSTQPNTGVPCPGAARRPSAWRIRSIPWLGPSWPLAAVIPPLKTSRPPAS